MIEVLYRSRIEVLLQGLLGQVALRVGLSIEDGVYASFAAIEGRLFCTTMNTETQEQQQK